ncbi:MAG: anti-virulence regulator CigR family protein [Planctomycetota bacterium]
MTRLAARILVAVLIAGLMPVSLIGSESVQKKTGDKVEKVQQKKDGKSSKSKSKKRGWKKVRKAVASAGVTAAVARRFARDKKVKKNKDVPPDVRKNLKEGKPLPKGLEAREVPAALRNELTVHEGYEWRIAGSDLILVSKDDQVVADVLEDVFE